MPRNDDELCFFLLPKNSDRRRRNVLQQGDDGMVNGERGALGRELFVYWNRMALANGAQRVACVRVVNLAEREAFHRVMNEEKIYSAIVLSGSKEGT